MNRDLIWDPDEQPPEPPGPPERGLVVVNGPRNSSLRKLRGEPVTEREWIMDSSPWGTWRLDDVEPRQGGSADFMQFDEAYPSEAMRKTASYTIEGLVALRSYDPLKRAQRNIASMQESFASMQGTLTSFMTWPEPYLPTTRPEPPKPSMVKPFWAQPLSPRKGRR